MTRGVCRAAAAACLLALVMSGCGGDAGLGNTDPVVVEVGESFQWNGFQIRKGWTLDSVESARGGEQVQQPVVRGDVTNLGDESRFAIFEIVFLQGGKALTSLPCSSEKIAQDKTAVFECPGFGKVFPSDYDEIQVQEFVRT